MENGIDIPSGSAVISLEEYEKLKEGYNNKVRETEEKLKEIKEKEEEIKNKIEEGLFCTKIVFSEEDWYGGSYDYKTNEVWKNTSEALKEVIKERDYFKKELAIKRVALEFKKETMFKIGTDKNSAYYKAINYFVSKEEALELLENNIQKRLSNLSKWDLFIEWLNR